MRSKIYYRICNKSSDLFQDMKHSGDLIFISHLWNMYDEPYHHYRQFKPIDKIAKNSISREDFIKRMEESGILQKHDFGEFFYSLHLADGVCCFDHEPSPKELERYVPNKQEKIIIFRGKEISRHIFNIPDGKFVKPMKIINEIILNA